MHIRYYSPIILLLSVVSPICTNFVVRNSTRSSWCTVSISSACCATFVDKYRHHTPTTLSCTLQFELIFQTCQIFLIKIRRKMDFLVRSATIRKIFFPGLLDAKLTPPKQSCLPYRACASELCLASHTLVDPRAIHAQ